MGEHLLGFAAEQKALHAAAAVRGHHDQVAFVLGRRADNGVIGEIADHVAGRRFHFRQFRGLVQDHILRVRGDRGVKAFGGVMRRQQRAFGLREQLADKPKMAISSHNLGNAYKELGELRRALDYYMKALNLFGELHDKRDLMLLHIDLGELYLKLGENSAARRYLDKALKFAEDGGHKMAARKGYEAYSKLFALEKDYEQAYKFQAQYMLLDKEISNAETSRQIAQMAISHELEQKEREAELQRIKNTELQKAYASLEEEKKRSEDLLNNILPEEVSEELKQYGRTKARSFDSVTVMFADIRNFTRISEQLSAEELVSGIDEYFEVFDKIVEQYQIEKIKTIGDAYYVPAGYPCQQPIMPLR